MATLMHSQMPCRFYKSANGCRHGDLCPYMHDGMRPECFSCDERSNGMELNRHSHDHKMCRTCHTIVMNNISAEREARREAHERKKEAIARGVCECGAKKERVNEKQRQLYCKTCEKLHKCSGCGDRAICRAITTHKRGKPCACGALCQGCHQARLRYEVRR